VSKIATTSAASVPQDVRMHFKIIMMGLVAGSLVAGCGDGAAPTSAGPAAAASAAVATSSAGAPNTAAGAGTDASTAAGTSTAAAGESTAAAGGGSGKSAGGSEAQLKAAVQAYSDAFLSGEGTKAYNLLSERCRKRTSLSEFTGIVTAAKQMYGSALPLKTYEAEVSGNLARVTYTYPIRAINQDREPWTREGGSWHQDDC
jgi:hypothetical protein